MQHILPFRLFLTKLSIPTIEKHCKFEIQRNELPLIDVLLSQRFFQHQCLHQHKVYVFVLNRAFVQVHHIFHLRQHFQQLFDLDLIVDCIDIV
jgi:hypothetical protein